MRTRAALSAVAVAILAACADGLFGPDRPKVGDLNVSAEITGLDRLTGYSVKVDIQSPRTIAVGEVLVVRGLGIGRHTVTLSNIVDNCTLDGANPREIEIAANGVTPLHLAFTCRARTGSA